MFEEMRNRLDSATAIWNALQYLRSDVDSCLDTYAEDDTEWGKESLERYKMQKEALEVVERALTKFVKQ